MIDPKTQSEVVFFLLSNISRLDDGHFTALMDKLEQWKAGRKKDNLLSDAMQNNCLTACKIFHGGEIQHLKDCPYYEGSLSQMYDQLQEHCRLIYKELELEIDSKYEYTAWVAFNFNDRKTLPPKYGKYLICRKDGKIHWETWNGSGWAYNHNQIAYWAVIVPPDKKT